MKNEFYLGRNGKLLDRISDLNRIRPEVTLDLKDLDVRPVSDLMDPADTERKRGFIAAQYLAWGRFGINGDLIKVKPISIPLSMRVAWEIEFIGRLDKPRPILAVDVVPFIYTCMADARCVLIKRKFDPGKDKLALIGGHQDVNGYDFQTPAAAIRTELAEEAGLRIEPTQDIFYRVPMADRLEVDVALEPELSTASELRLIGTWETSDEERLPHLGRKRVDWTTAYFLPIYLGGKIAGLGPAVLNKWFRAGDDAKEIVFVSCRDIFQESKRELINFGILHHEVIFNRAADMFQALPMHTFPMRALD